MADTVAGRTGAARLSRTSSALARQGVGELLLGHLGAAADVRALRALVEILLAVADHVDAAVGPLRPVPGGRATLGGLRVRGSLLVLGLPVVADLLERVLDRRPRRLVRAGLGVVLVLCRVERLGVGALRLFG